MTKTHGSKMTFLVVCGLLFAVILLFVPRGADAAQVNSRLGGGNALLRATSGLSHSNSASELFAHLTFASTRGGQPEPLPSDENSNSGGNTSTDQSDGENGADATSAGGAGGNGGNNGGATAGNGGNGGDGGAAADGGLIRAGGAVSNAHALNMLNAVIVRIGR